MFVVFQLEERWLIDVVVYIRIAITGVEAFIEEEAVDAAPVVQS